MKIETVWFEGDCVKCTMCVEEASGVFEFVAGVGPQVKQGADIASFTEGIKQAACLCPTQYIKYKI